MAQTAACDTIKKRTLRPRPIPVDHGWQLLGRFAEPFIAVFRTWSTHALRCLASPCLSLLVLWRSGGRNCVFFWLLTRCVLFLCILSPWRFSLMEISHSCRCLPISCLNRWILSANLLELLEPLLFWPFLFCGVCAAGLLKLAVNSVNPKKTTETTRKTPANFRKTHANTRKNPQIRKRRFLDFLNAMKTWSSLHLCVRWC